MCWHVIHDTPISCLDHACIVEYIVCSRNSFARYTVLTRFTVLQGILLNGCGRSVCLVSNMQRRAYVFGNGCMSFVVLRCVMYLGMPSSCVTYMAFGFLVGGLAAPPAAIEPEDLDAANPWAMLLRTLLPWINAGQAPDYDQQDDGESDDGTVESYNDLAGAGGAAEGVAGEAEGAHAPADEEDDLD